MTNKKDYAPITYNCNGATVDFPFGWKILEKESVIVTYCTEEENTVLQLDKDYTVDFDEVGGNIKTKVAYASDSSIKIERKASLYQGKTFSTSSGFQASEIEKAFDNTSINLQDMDFKIDNFVESFSDEIEKKIIANKENTDEQIQNNKQDTDEQIEDFKQEINATIEAVNQAAQKINKLETAVEKATNSATLAENKAKEVDNTLENAKSEMNEKLVQADNAINEITAKVDEVDKKTDNAINNIENKTTEEINKIRSVGFFMKNDKLYYIDSKGETKEFRAGSSLPLLTPIWSGHLVDDISYLRSDTFAWQDGSVYSAVYNKLVEEYDDENSVEETENGVIFKRTPSGFKIADSAQEQNIVDLYETTGVAWYYLLDKSNNRFKLPRTKYDFVGLRTSVGNYVEESLPNLTGSLCSGSSTRGCFTAATGLFSKGPVVSNFFTVTSNSSAQPAGYAYADASNCSSAYQDGAPVQQRATEMYLYFYVGEYSQSAIEQSAGITAETLNNKADISAVDGKWVFINSTIVSEATIKEGATAQYDVSSIFPDDDNVYEFMYQIAYNPSANAANCWIETDKIAQGFKQGTNGNMLRNSATSLLQTKTINIRTASGGGNLSAATLTILAYRRIGTNE